MLLLHSAFPLENSVGSVNEDLYYNRMATAEQIFEWLAILWERGFCHDNPQGTLSCHNSCDILIFEGALSCPCWYMWFFFSNFTTSIVCCSTMPCYAVVFVNRMGKLRLLCKSSAKTFHTWSTDTRIK